MLQVYQPGVPYAISRGLECVLDYNGLVLNERYQYRDMFRITSISGLGDAEVRDAREVNPARHGETPLPSFYGGRTITIEGEIMAGNLDRMRYMQQQLRTAFSELEEKALTFRFWDVSDDFSYDSVSAGWWTRQNGSAPTAQSGILRPADANNLVMHWNRGGADETMEGDCLINFTVGGNVSTSAIGALLKNDGALSNSHDAIAGYIVFGGSLSIAKIVNGVGSTLAITTLTTGLSSSESRYIRLRVEGNDVLAEVWDEEPTILGTPTDTLTHTLTGSDATTFGSGTGGYGGFLVTGDNNWSINQFDLTSLTNPDVFCMCKKNAPIQMDEVQQHADQYRRRFQLSLRASDPFLYSTAEYFDSVIPTSVNVPGRIYNRTHDMYYDTYLDAESDPTSEINQAFIFNPGEIATYPVMRIKGGLVSPRITNESTEESMFLSGSIADNDHLDIDFAARTVVDSNGVSRYGMIRSDSEWLSVLPGMNQFSISPQSFSGSPLLTIVNRGAWL